MCLGLTKPYALTTSICIGVYSGGGGGETEDQAERVHCLPCLMSRAEYEGSCGTPRSQCLRRD